MEGVVIRFAACVTIVAALLCSLVLGTAAQDFDELDSAATEAFELRRFAEAAQLAEQTLAAADAEGLADTDPRRLDALGVLAGTAQWFGDLDAEEVHLHAILAVMEANFGGPGNINSAFAMEALAYLHARAGRPDAAEAMLAEVVALREPSIIEGNDPFETVHVAIRARIALERGDWANAYDGFTQVVDRIAAAGAVPQRDMRGFVFETDSWTFLGLVRAAWGLIGGAQGDRAGPADEAFRAMQWKWRTSAASALLRAAARPYAEDEARTEAQRELEARRAELDDLVERQANFPQTRAKTPEQLAIEQELEQALARQDTGAQMRAMQRSLELTEKLVQLMQECPTGCEAEMARLQADIAQAANPSQDAGMEIAELQRRLEQATDPAEDAAFHEEWNRLGAEMRRKQAAFEKLQRAFDERYGKVGDGPDRSAAFLVEPDPIGIAEAQALLGPDDALLAYLVADEMSFVWAISAESISWAPVPVAAHELLSRVSLLVHGADPNGSVRGARALTTPEAGFDLDEAHALFRLLVGPVGEALAGKGHVYLVPTGPITALPFHALVTEPPDPALKGAGALQGAAWLARRHAVTVLPSIVSLRAVGAFADKGRAIEPFVGFGDPRLDGDGDDRRGLSQFFNGARADLAQLRRLAPLPDTADELHAVAQAVGAGAEAVFIGERATEASVKNMAVGNYRVVHFATHGLVAGELRGLAEPAIVLTPPGRATVEDDGLLTAGEIATLALNADWVVLSACNTAAASAAGAEAFSGLARAFFHAGARSLLVSYWPVYSRAAVTLTTGAFDALADDPGIGRAEALRRSMLALIESGQPAQLEPRYWAPFVVMGEGAPRRW